MSVAVPALDDEMELVLILLSLVSIGEAGGLSNREAVDDVTVAVAVAGCGGETICPPPPNNEAEF